MSAPNMPDQRQPLPDRLPPLREDLQLHAAAPHPDGSPAWTVQDPVNNVFYRIGWLEFELLSRWERGTPAALLEAARAETLLDPTEDELAELIGFLQQNHLLGLHDPGHTERLVALYRRARLSRAQWLLHHYLFFRIPLWHPDRWLQRALPWLDWVFRPAAAVAIGVAALAALVLTARQIDVFAASFVDTLSPGGLLGYLLALAVAKSLHELGHAVTATRYGVRVAHMGVAFLVLWPMLYTDTGESWRLRDRRQRLAIASAGILTELALAALATLAWNLTEPGDLRQSLFFLATTAWLISLTLNASPFMRFDGYFILSDLLDLPNLHERAGALARTWLRRVLLGWDDPDPEHFPAPRRRALIAFALVTWVYRLAMFLGIAVAVYYLFFKLLGILLFVVEIVWFVLRPLAAEFAVWRQRRGDIRPSRRRAAALAGGLLLLAGLLPLDLTVRAAGWAHAEAAHPIYSPGPGRIEALPAHNGPVGRDAPLVDLADPDHAMKAALAVAGSEALQRQLAGLAAMADGEEKRRALLEQHGLKLAEQSAERDEQARLRLQAPVAGVLADLDPDLAPGVWVSPRQPLGVVIDPARWIVDAYVGQHDLPRIRPGDAVRFYPSDDALFPLGGTVVETDTQRIGELPHPALAARHGGPLPVLPEARALVPRDALYRVRIRLGAAPDRLAVRAGVAVIEAAPRSWLVDAGKSLLVVLIREATF